MAVPTLSVQQVQASIATIDYTSPIIFDNVFTSMAFLVRMMSGGNVQFVDGGERIKQPFIYAKKSGGSYTQGATFNTDYVETKTNFWSVWKKYYANITLRDHDLGTNSGTQIVIDLVSAEMQEAELRLKDDIASDLVTSDGTDSNVITGLPAIADDNTNVATYLNVDRSGTDDVAIAAQGQYNGAGGATRWSVFRTMMGNCTIGNVKPDLILTTQTMWDKLADTAQPSQRFTSPDLAAVGFESLRFMGADIVVDSKVDSGRAYFLTTSTMKLFVNTQRNLDFTGWKPSTNNNDLVGQLLWWMELICGAPRQNGQIRALT